MLAIISLSFRDASVKKELLYSLWSGFFGEGISLLWSQFGQWLTHAEPQTFKQCYWLKNAFILRYVSVTILLPKLYHVAKCFAGEMVNILRLFLRKKKDFYFEVVINTKFLED